MANPDTTLSHQRSAVLDQIMALRAEDDRFRAYVELTEVERLAHNANPPVVMCGCAEWATCTHPWPQRIRLHG